MTAPLDLDALDALLAKATPRPWLRDGSCVYIHADDMHIAEADRHTDARLIVAAVNALPGLIAHVRALELVIAEVDALLVNATDAKTWGDAQAAIDAARAAVTVETKP
jgi:hypothetical protein